jgi:hypothetical protein
MAIQEHKLSRIIQMDKIEKICERLELGEPLSVICKDKTMPVSGLCWIR